MLAQERRYNALTQWQIEEYRSDPLGHLYWQQTKSSVNGPQLEQRSQFTLATGALTSRSAAFPTSPTTNTIWPDEVTATTEPSGGVIRTGEVQRNFNSGTYVLYGATRTYLSADGQTRVVQRYQVNSNIGNGVFEEYRYDALGRRVQMRSRKTPTPPPGGGLLATLCTVVTGNPCASSISRWVWDGAQLLGETRAPGQDGLSAPTLDQLTGSPPSYGTVGYVHIGGWDEPRALLDGRVFNPNWRGLPESSQLADGTAPDCSFGLGGSCITVNWPTDVGPYCRQPIPVPQGTIVPTWLGSLAANGATESRRLHRRFREYDPATGQFTREDPIGLGGGGNLYGFANGDPVNFGDPFGLQACSPREPLECPSFSGTAARGVIRETAARLAAVQPLMQAAAAISLMAPMGGGEAAITTLGLGKTLTFFRGVSAAEHADVVAAGALRAGAAAAGNTGKYLTNTVVAAAEWGAKHGAGSQVLRIRVAADATRAFTRLGRIDAIGEAWWAPIESLKGAKIDVIGSAVRTSVPK